MKTPDIPANEKSRLETLRAQNILDTPNEERFDRLTRMVKRIFDVPIAIVSLIDENRQWFKSCIGLDVTETSRDVSFCGHAILGQEIFMIENATLDSRFHDNPLVTGDPNIRFYAGCPLQAANGEQLGTLCIIDNKPRTLSQEELETLKDFAAMAEREIAAVQLATIDELTQISNRRGFMMLAEHGLNLCIRQKIPASLVFFDLNKFKQINDDYGHAEGDKALIIFSDYIKNNLRESDLFARVGGDEFVVLFTNTTKKQAEDVITKSILLLEKYNKTSQESYDISFSYGIVDYNPLHHHGVEALMADGDEKMYALKKKRMSH
ncbi:MAG: sensor domain-containing diguanylate cyclase [Cellvibrionaceae bacterium]